MSEENVEVVRRAFEAWNQGGAESAKRFWAEDYEFHDPPKLSRPSSGAGQGCRRCLFERSDQRSRRPEGDDRRCESAG